MSDRGKILYSFSLYPYLRLFALIELLKNSLLFSLFKSLRPNAQLIAQTLMGA